MSKMPQERRTRMSSFRERWGSLTVEQAKELNKAVQRTVEEDS